MKIFISHSRRDKELVYSITKILYRVGVKPYIAEFEELGELGRLTAENLKSEISASDMLALMLTRNVCVSPYTRNWVAYEIGVAHAFGKPIWVFESEHEFVEDYPIPRVDYYFIFNPELRGDWARIEEEFRKLSQAQSLEVSTTLGGLIIGWILGGPAGSLLGLIAGRVLGAQRAEELRKQPSQGFSKIRVQCPVCRASYVVIGGNQRLLGGFPCPVCRRYIWLIR